MFKSSDKQSSISSLNNIIQKRLNNSNKIQVVKLLNSSDPSSITSSSPPLLPSISHSSEIKDMVELWLYKRSKQVEPKKDSNNQVLRTIR